jgi:predicted nucleotidyltransferase
VDVLVRLDDDRSLLDHVALKQDLEDLLGCRVDVVTEKALHELLREAILGEAVPL